MDFGNWHDAVLNNLFTHRLSFGAVILLALAAYKLVVCPYRHLQDIPGPWWAPFSRLWLFITLASEDSPNRYIAVNDQYGTMCPPRQAY